MLEAAPAAPALPPPIHRPGVALTALSALVVVLFIVWIGWLHRSGSKLDGVTAPEQALELVVARGMELREALTGAPRWERTLYRTLTSDGADELEQALAWYEELASRSLDPAVDLHLAVLAGEAGDRGRVRRMADEWERRQDPLPALADVVRTAYLEEPAAGADELAVQGEVLDALPLGWFADRLTIAWATRADDAERLAASREDLAERVRRLLWRVRGLVGAEALVLAGGVVLAVALWRRRSALRIADAPLPPPWPAGRGLVVLVRGGAAGIAVIVASVFATGLVEPWIALDHPLVEAATWPLMYVPILLLARRHLLRPHGLGFARALGLDVVPGGGRRLLGVVLALLAVAALGEWVLTTGAGALGLSSHWSEWFDEELAWGDATTVAASLVGAVVVAPIFEEIVFRGLLYATLRRRLAPGSASVASAAIFAVAHGYGVVGFVDVLWSGWLWAWSFERTGSVLPGVLAHAATNLMVSLGVIVLLR